MLELREMREEIISLREELHAGKTKLREEEGGKENSIIGTMIWKILWRLRLSKNRLRRQYDHVNETLTG